MQLAKLTAGMGVMVLLGACAQYKDSPLDLSKEEALWKQQSLSIQGSRELKLKKAGQIGLVLNPDLNKARLKLASSEEVEKQAGWWNDPSFSWDAKQDLQDSSVINLDGGLAFTIPVTGLPALEKQVAAQYKEADYWNLRQSELDFLTSLDQEWSKWGISEQKKALINARLENMKKEEAQFSALYNVGELDSTARQIATQRYNNALRELQKSMEEELDQRMSLIKLMGLHPSAAGVFRFMPSFSDKAPGIVATPSPAALTQVPRLLGQLATYAGNETQLKTEIRKQYPEIELGPAFTRDDGEKELGLSLGFNIPLWNRNRQAIAEAEGNRNMVRQETVQLWRDLLQKTQQLSQQQKLVHSHCQAEQQRLDNFSANLKKLEQLYKIGESSLADLAEARQQVYESKLAYLESLNNLVQLQAQLRYMTSASLTKN